MNIKRLYDLEKRLVNEVNPFIESVYLVGTTMEVRFEKVFTQVDERQFTTLKSICFAYLIKQTGKGIKDISFECFTSLKFTITTKL